MFCFPNSLGISAKDKSALFSREDELFRRSDHKDYWIYIFISRNKRKFVSHLLKLLPGKDQSD